MYSYPTKSKEDLSILSAELSIDDVYTNAALSIALLTIQCRLRRSNYLRKSYESQERGISKKRDLNHTFISCQFGPDVC